MNLRPYQAQLITDIRLQYQLGHKSVLAVLPTGGGKTISGWRCGPASSNGLPVKYLPASCKTS